MRKKIQMWEGILRGSIREIRDESTPLSILIALHNICSHGELLEEIGLNVTDESLGQLFDGFDLSINALKNMNDKSNK
jgi:hypothetical protein